MTVLRGCNVFRLPYAFLKPNVNIRPSENRFARFCETKTDCRKTKRQRQPENRILGFRLPCCLSLQQLYFSPRRAKIPKLKSSRNVYLLIKKLHLVSWRGGCPTFGVQFMGSDGLFCICVESNTVIQNQIFISYANNPGIPFPVVQFESLGSKTMVSVVPNPPVHVC